MSKALLALICMPLLMGGACEKKAVKPGDTGAIAALDRETASGEGDRPVDTKPLPGIDVKKLSSDQQKSFYRLVDSLSSPCGKAHSLRTSFTSDTSCKRAPFAVRYVLSLLEDEATEAETRDLYERRYKATAAPVKIDVSQAPHVGPTDAPVKLIEFYDYGCPHCAEFRPEMEQVAKDEAGKVVEYFMQFPLPMHVDSKSAAQAALAAWKQGKFQQMHDLLFEHPDEHDHAGVTKLAQQIGLDMDKFQSDYTAAAAHVEADIKAGDALGVDSTPTVFFNNRKYDGPRQPKYIEMWIDEELAVNR